MDPGKRAENIARGLPGAVAKRAKAVIDCVGCAGPLPFPAVWPAPPCTMLLPGKALGEEPLLPDDPDLVGALGAAWHGAAFLQTPQALEA